MTGVYLNGRRAVDWEIPAIAHARECEQARDLAVLAGVLTEAPPRPAPGRMVADISIGVKFS